MHIDTQILFELLINLLDCIIFFYLISKKLTITKNPVLRIFCFLFFWASVMILNSINLPSTPRMLLTFLIMNITALIISRSPKAHTLFWGSLYMIICTLSDFVTFFAGYIFTSNTANERLYTPSIRNQLTLIYLFTAFLITLFITRKKSEKQKISTFLYVSYSLLILFAFSAIELLIDLLPTIDQKSIHNEWIIYYVIIIFFIILSLVTALLYFLNRLYQKNLLLSAELQCQQFEARQYETLSHTNQILRTWKHDFKHYLSVIQILNSQKNYDQLTDYISSLSVELEKPIWSIQTGNHIVDAIISSKLPVMEKQHIHFSHELFFPRELPLTSLELTSLLGNLFDNAIEACAKVYPVTQRTIDLQIKCYNQSLLFIMTNRYNGKYKRSGQNRFYSTKEEGVHGIGLQRITKIIEHANGFIQINPDADFFQVNIVIPLIPRSDSDSQNENK